MELMLTTFLVLRSVTPPNNRSFRGQSNEIKLLCFPFGRSIVGCGSLTTAEMAFGYNREVFAVPGRISDRQSQGCNMLIKTKGAHLLGRAEDLPFILNWTLKPRSKALQKKVFVALGAEEKEIYNFLYTKGKSSLHSIAFNCKLPTSMAAYVLLSLELKGVLKPFPGKEYELI